VEAMMSSSAKAAMAIMPVPAASGPITRPMTSIDSREKTAVAAVSASTQAGEREAGRRNLGPPAWNPWPGTLRTASQG